MKNNKTLILTLLLASGLVNVANLLAQDEKQDKALQQAKSPTDVSQNWQCKWCELDAAEGSQWRVDFGFHWLSENDDFFSRYRGFDDDGVFGLTSFHGRIQDASGRYWLFEGNELWLDNRLFNIETGVQGSYHASLGYREIQQLNDRVKSPFIDSGSQQLELPTSWVFALSTPDFTELDTSLVSYDLHSKRKQIDLAAVIQDNENLPQIRVSYQKETKSGINSYGGAIGNDNAFDVTASLLPLPFNYETEQVDASINYQFAEWQFQAGFYNSVFNDKQGSFVWQNPFLNTTSDWGQASASPDSQFQQVYLFSSYRFTPKTKGNAYLAIGQMEQDEVFESYSINPNIITATLPVDSLNGKVNTLTGQLKLTSRLSSQWRLQAAYRYNEKDNKTVSNIYQYVVNDTLNSLTPRRSVPFSFDKTEFKTTAEYRSQDYGKWVFGIEHEAFDRTYQERKETDELTLWIDYIKTWSDKFDSRIKLESGSRDGDFYRTLNTILPPENPLLRKFNFADRDRQRLTFDTNFYPLDNTSISLSLDVGQDEYTRSVIGLQQSDYRAINIDYSWNNTEDLTLFSFISSEFYCSQQTGSQTYALPDWFNDSKDYSLTLGGGLEYQMVEDTLKIGTDIVYTRSKEVNHLTSDTLGLSLESLPEFKVKILSVELFADYQISESTALHSRLLYQSYKDNDIQDYALSADSVVDILLFENEDMDQNTTYLSVAVSYQF